MNRTVIFISNLELWSMGKGKGGQAFTKTVDGYLEDGWNVWLVTNLPSNKEYFESKGANLSFVEPSFCYKYRNIKHIGSFFRIIDHLITTRKFKKAIKEILSKINSRHVALYAYEVFAVKAAKETSIELKIPFVSRFQGTIISQYKINLYNRIRLYPHIQAIETPSDLVIMTNDGTQGDRMLSELHNRSKSLFLLNGLDLMNKNIDEYKEKFDRQCFRQRLFPGIEKKECIFLTVSRLQGWKRLDRAIDGFAEYCLQNEGGKLCIVGDGDEKEALEERVRKYGIQNRVKFTGAVPHDDVYDYMVSCDVFLSLYDLSNVGNPLLEAMTLGKCIITYDVGDTSKFIQHFQNGILIQQGDMNKLGAYMTEISQNENERERMGACAKEFARKNFKTWDKRIKLEIDELKRLVG